MTDQTGQVQEAAPTEGAVAQVSPDVQEAQWTDGFNDATKAFAIGKGWKDPSAVVTSYQNLEKLAKGAKDVIAKPNFENVDEVNAFYNELGRPEASTDYKLQSQDNTSQEFLDWYKGSAHENGLSQEQAEKLFNSYVEYESQFMNQHNESLESDRLQEIEDLKRELGAGINKEIEISKRGWGQLGLDQEDIDYMEEKLGPTLAYKLGVELSQAKGAMEDGFVDGDSVGQGFGMGLTPEAAKIKIAHKMADPNFKKAYFEDKGPAHIEAVREMERLNSYAEGIQPY